MLGATDRLGHKLHQSAGFTGWKFSAWQSGFGFWGALRRVTAYDESVALETRVEHVVAEPRRMATREILTLLSMVPAPPADGRAQLDGPRPASRP